MKRFFLILGLVTSINVLGQESENTLQKVCRVNLISPGVELELPITPKSTISANTGIGISGSYLNLSYSPNSGFLYFVAPFIDLSYKKIYNIDSRLSKGKSISGNSGNYWGLRLLTNLNEIYSENVERYDNIDFAFGPTWGIQRSTGNFHLLFDFGPVYYFDTKGNNGFFPLAIQLNIGYNLKKW